jgi:tetratricopeptide (TPR) repeat protein
LQEPAFETRGTAEPSPFEAAPLEVPSPEPPPAFEAAPQFPEPAPTDEITFEGLDAGMPPLEDKESFAEDSHQTAVPAGDVREQPFREEAPLPVEETEVFGGAAETREELVGEVREPEHAVQQPAAEVQADIGEIWAEAEFYFQQGLFDEAKKHYARIVELNPSERRAIERLGEISREEEQTLEFSKLAEAVEDLGGAAGGAGDGQEMPLSASDEDAVRSLMQEISQLKKPEKPAAPFPLAEEEAVFPPPQLSAPGKKAGPAVTPAVGSRSGAEFDGNEEDFFDLGEELNKESKASPARQSAQSSDDFFDLAAELRDELSTVAVPERSAGPTEEQSLDEIFEDFKRGVEQQSVKEDVDTHYNLGVAYKEMGLLDDAISEFIMTPEEEPKYILSRYMLGLCYMEKGDYQNAADEIQNALRNAESLSEEEQDTLGMHYDLGLAYQGAGKLNNAISEFQIVHALDPEYRDTATKLKELQQGDFISLDQLKDDIEREISSKFLEAGERIEREERNRKNEKVRN